jgi:two-component system, chemotaxis family, response regulator Rcp1
VTKGPKRLQVAIYLSNHFFFTLQLYPLKQYRILLVEDNEGDILLTKEAFSDSHFPHQLQVLRDGKAAVDFLSEVQKNKEQELPELILLDINLPKMNGYEVLAFIKEKPALQNISVIILTTSSAETDMMSSYKNLVNGYFIKPIAIEGYKDLVAKLVDFSLTNLHLPQSKKIA